MDAITILLLAASTTFIVDTVSGTPQAAKPAAAPSALGAGNGNPPASLPSTASHDYPIDLPTALGLADASNPQVQVAREQVRQALAQQTQARVLWLPTVRGGLSYFRHDGMLQETPGRVIEVNRNSLLAGAGVATTGAGAPMLPGVHAEFHLADALFQPLAARQVVRARQAASMTATNDMLFAVAIAYLELERAHQDAMIARDVLGDTKKLADITEAYAKSGQGLQADADRMRTEKALRENEMIRADEQARVAGARLAQLLRLDPLVRLVPVQLRLTPMDVIDARTDVQEHLATALASRPELTEQESLVGEAAERLRRERALPLVPTISLGLSTAGFGGGRSTSIDPFADRTDFQALVYWQLRNLGFGDWAAQRERASLLRQAEFRRQGITDLVRREVVEAHTQVEMRRRQIAIAEGGVKAAVDSLRRNLERIQNAQGLPIEVLQSNQALAQSAREYLRAVFEYNAAQFALARAIGMLVTPTAPETSAPPSQGR